MSSNALVVKREALNEDYLPGRLVAREDELDRIQRCLHPLTRGDRPLHVWIQGRSGTGKTALAQAVLRELEQRYNIPGEHISCWRYHSLYKVVDALVDQLRILRAEQQDTALKLKRLERHLEGKPFVLVLDEIDSLSPKERNTIVHAFTGLSQIGLICISRHEEALFSLDPSTQSRLSPHLVFCSEYTPQDLDEILRDRAGLAFDPRLLSGDVSKQIAESSAGNARAALQTLRGAAEWAEQGRDTCIRTEHIEKARQNLSDFRKARILASLTGDHRILYELVRQEGQICSRQLRATYLKQCERLKRKPIAVRTFSKYLNRLAQCGLIACERRQEKGKGRLFSVGTQMEERHA